MENIFDRCAAAVRSAFTDYEKSIKSFVDTEQRLIALYNKKLTKLKSFKSAAEGESLLAEAKTIRVQLEKVVDSAKAAKKTFLARQDDAFASVIEKYRALSAYAVATGGPIGIQYLLDECRGFDAAAGNYADRETIFHGILDLAGIVADSLDAETPVKSTILSDYENISDPEAQTAFFKKHKNEIHAAYDTSISNSQEDLSTQK